MVYLKNGFAIHPAKNAVNIYTFLYTETISIYWIGLDYHISKDRSSGSTEIYMAFNNHMAMKPTVMYSDKNMQRW